MFFHKKNLTTQHLNLKTTAASRKPETLIEILQRAVKFKLSQRVQRTLVNKAEARTVPEFTVEVNEERTAADNAVSGFECRCRLRLSS